MAAEYLPPGKKPALQVIQLFCCILVFLKSFLFIIIHLFPFYLIFVIKESRNILYLLNIDKC